MIEERSFSISEMLKLVQKHHLDYLENESLDSDISILQSGFVDIIMDDIGQKQSLTDAQAKFVQYVLPNMILHKVPKLEDVLNLYGLSLQTRFYYANAVWDPCGFFD